MLGPRNVRYKLTMARIAANLLLALSVVLLCQITFAFKFETWMNRGYVFFKELVEDEEGA